MISPDLKKQIFLSLPISFKCERGLFAVHKEYAPFAKVSEYLAKHPNDVYLALDFADDEIFRQETPCNYTYNYNVDNSANEVIMDVGTRNRMSLNVHVYAAWTPSYTNILQSVEEILNQMQFWVMFDLEKIVDYAHVESIQSIDETADRIMHRVVSCSFVYSNTIQRVVPEINNIEYTVQKEAPLPPASMVFKI